MLGCQLYTMASEKKTKIEKKTNKKKFVKSIVYTMASNCMQWHPPLYIQRYVICSDQLLCKLNQNKCKKNKLTTTTTKNGHTVNTNTKT